MLTDCLEVLGKFCVTLPSKLGSGVKLESKPMSAEEVDAIRSRLAGSGHFRAICVGSPRIGTVAHLVCEVRQAVLAGRTAAGRRLDLEFVKQLHESVASGDDASDLKQASLAIANYACGAFKLGITGCAFQLGIISLGS